MGISTILLIVLILALCGAFGGGYVGAQPAVGLGTVLLILLILLLLGVI